MKEIIIKNFNKLILRWLILICLVYAIIHFYRGFQLTPYIFIIEIIFGVALYTFKDRLDPNKLSIALSLMLLSLITLIALFTGGSSAPAIYWYIPVLMYIYIVNTGSIKLYFTALNIFIYSSLFYLTYNSLLPNSLIPEESKSTQLFLNAVVATIFIYYNSKKNEEILNIQNEKLKESLQRQELMTKGIEAGVFDWQDLTKTDVYWSPKLYEILGYKNLEIKANTDFFMSQVHPEDILKINENNQKQLSIGNIVKSEYHIKKKNGEYIWIRSNSYVEKDKDGNPTRFIGGLTDETINIENRNKLQEAKEKAEMASKAKTVFLENMTHEIRTPLNGIIGLSEVLGEKIKDEEQIELLKDITTSGDQLLGIVSDILDFGKIEKQQIQIFNQEIKLAKLLEKVGSVYKTLSTRKDLKFEINFEKLENDSFILDKNKITQVLNNLIGNAFKFTKQGNIKVIVTELENELEFIVKDTGLGISEHEIQDIFTPFIQAEGSNKIDAYGTGLGLSIVKSLVEIMDGKIDVTSKINKGTKFTFTIKKVLPTLKNKTPPEQLKENKLNRVEIGTILVVEDNKMNLKVITSHLKSHDLKYEIAINGKEAVDKCKKELFSIIFMDLQLPILSGIDATKKIREFNKDSIIIALTANAFDEAQEQCLNAGMNDFLTKPIKKDRLVQAINKFTI